MYCAHGASCCESPLKELGFSVRLPDGLSTSGSQVSSNSMNSAGQNEASPTPGINQGSPEGFQSDGTAFQDSGQPGHGAGPPKTQPFCCTTAGSGRPKVTTNLTEPTQECTDE